MPQPITQPKSQDVRTASLSDGLGGTHPGPSVVACLLERSFHRCLKFNLKKLLIMCIRNRQAFPGPPGEFGVAIPPDERSISSQANNLNSGTLHSETAIAILPEERRQFKQNLSLNDEPPSMTENTLLPEERESLLEREEMQVLVYFVV
jgi:hypothetical protein